VFPARRASTIPQAGSVVEIQKAQGAEDVTVALTTPDGRQFSIRFDRIYDQTLAQFS
jgi:hypothetical protein